MFPGPYVIYGSKRSFFTAKVENILRFLDLPYEFIEKMPHDGSAIETRGGTGAIPLLQTPEDWVLWDSTPIAQLLSDRFPERPLLPTTPVQRAGARLLEDWFDEWFTRASMYTRWNFPDSVQAVMQGEFARRAFDRPWADLRRDEKASLKPMFEQFEPLRRMMTEEAAPRIATTLETGKDVMVWFESFLTDLANHLEQHSFLLGERPCVADFSLSGGFSAHFAYDPWPRAFIEKRQPATLDYALRCWEARSGEQRWPQGDVLPATWAPFFDEMQARFLVYLERNREALGRKVEAIDIDLGYGEVSIVTSAYRELSRMDIRSEILSLPEAELERVRQSIPAGVIEVYLLPPLDDPPKLRA